MSTIFALSTAYQKSAIAIIRVSGPKAYESALKITGKTSLTPNKATLSILFNPLSSTNLQIDEAVVVYFKAPNSYTGEDLIEYHIHGSLAIIKEMLEVLSNQPEHNMAERGEFTKRALMNLKIDMLKAESINDLINAETKIQKQQAIKGMLGENHSIYKNYENQIKEILALTETTIDFSDQDIDEDLFKYINDKLNQLILEIDKNIANLSGVEKLKQGVNIAILGEPNVGKSSLINFITKEKVSIVSPIAGTTRDVVQTSIDFYGFSINIADTAGLRSNTNDVIEKEGIKRARDKIKSADIKIIILSADSIANTSKEILDYIDENSIVLINKIDTIYNINEENYKNIFSDFKNKVLQILNNLNINNIDNSVILTSLMLNKQEKQLGLDVFTKTLVSKLQEITKILENPVITQKRHQQIMSKVVFELKEIEKVNHDIVLSSMHLRTALNYLGQITGKTNIEDILDIIFSKFCIGK